MPKDSLLIDSTQNFFDALGGVEETVSKVTKIPDMNYYLEIALRFGINLVAILILVRVIYYTTHKNKDYLYTFILFNVLIFIICILLSSTKIKTGFAFGMFAIFSIIRYRTVTVPIKEMGYFFTAVGLGLLNSLADTNDNYILILAFNLIILILTLLLDKFVGLKHENVKEIVYERIDLIRSEKRQEMLEDLQKRTGLPIHKVEIRNVNFLRDTANIFAYYYARDNENRTDLKFTDDEANAS